MYNVQTAKWSGQYTWLVTVICELQPHEILP